MSSISVPPRRAPKHRGVQAGNKAPAKLPPPQRRLGNEVRTKDLQRSLRIGQDARYKEIKSYSETESLRMARIMQDDNLFYRAYTPSPEPTALPADLVEKLGTQRASSYLSRSAEPESSHGQSTAPTAAGESSHGQSAAPTAVGESSHGQSAAPTAVGAVDIGGGLDITDHHMRMLAEGECQGYEQMKTDKFSGRIGWEETFRSNVKKLIIDLKLSSDPHCRLNHLDRLHGWFTTEGRKQARKEKESPNFLTFQSHERPAPGSARGIPPLFNDTTLSMAPMVGMARSPRLAPFLVASKPPPPPPGYK